MLDGVKRSRGDPPEIVIPAKAGIQNDGSARQYPPNWTPAVVLLGPRQAGKTPLALAEAERHGDALYLDLELPSAQRQMDDPEAFLLSHQGRLIIPDEVQRLPEIFAVLRSVIDIRRRSGEATGQFLLLGSA